MGAGRVFINGMMCDTNGTRKSWLQVVQHRVCHGNSHAAFNGGSFLNNNTSRRRS